jgi:hypothetical protein
MQYFPASPREAGHQEEKECVLKEGTRSMIPDPSETCRKKFLLAESAHREALSARRNHRFSAFTGMLPTPAMHHPQFKISFPLLCRHCTVSRR